MYFQVVFVQILSGGSLCGKSYVDELAEILLCEGGDVELCARTSKHIRVLAIYPLTLTLSFSLSFTLCLASFHIAHSYIICLASLCVPLV